MLEIPMTLIRENRPRNREAALKYWCAVNKNSFCRLLKIGHIRMDDDISENRKASGKEIIYVNLCHDGS